MSDIFSKLYKLKQKKISKPTTMKNNDFNYGTIEYKNKWEIDSSTTAKRGNIMNRKVKVTIIKKKVG